MISLISMFSLCYFFSIAFGGLLVLEPGMMPVVENWPEIMGMSSKEAIAKLHQHFPKIPVQTVMGMPTNSHIEMNKIVLHMNEEDQVIFMPTLYSQVPIQKDWPELVGMPLKEAEKKIYEELPVVQIEVNRMDSPNALTSEHSPMKVKIMIDEEGIVIQPPTNA